MNLVMLSGNSLRNRDWIYEARGHLADQFDDTYIQDYRHWTSGDEWIDLPHELEVLAHQNFASDYGVFAKSIGTVLTTLALEQNILAPKFLLFCGLPLGYIEKDYPQFASVLAASNLPLVIVHNTNDTVGSAEAVREYLKVPLAETDYTFIETPGDTHDYEDYKLLIQQLTELKNDHSRD